MSALVLEDVIARVEQLPKLPDTSLRLMRLVNDPTATLKQIVDVIRYDQAVTGEVLRLCNSAYYGFNRKIASLDEAVHYLGTTKVMQLVMEAHAQTLLGPAQSGYGLRPGSLWVHSVGVAIGARRIAERAAPSDAGLLFTAGLMHDVGKVVLNEYMATDFARVAAIVTQERIPFCEAEQRVLGTTHAEVGALLAEKWGLPDAIVNCIRHHYNPAELAEPDVRVDIIHVADAACTLMGVGGGDDGLMYRPDAEVAARIGIHEHEIEELGAFIVDELKSVEALFHRE